MLNKYIKGQFTDQYNVTVGVEFTSKTIRIDQKLQVKLQIWDTVKIALSRPVRKHSGPSCVPSTKESVEFSLLLVLIARKASTIQKDGFARHDKMPTRKQSYFWWEPKPILIFIAKSVRKGLRNISKKLEEFFILKQVPKRVTISSWQIDIDIVI